MNLILLLTALLSLNVSFAAEIDTDCIAINGNKDKIIQTVATKGQTKGSIAQ